MRASTISIIASVLFAAAGARADTAILLESHAEAPPEDAAHYVQYLVTSMGKDAPLHGARLRERIESQISATPGPPEKREDLHAQAKKGREQFIDGSFKKAIATLEQARGAMLERPALLATNQPLRDSLYMALLYLAHAYLRSSEGEKATERIGEVIRSFPDKELSLAKYGPELVKFYRKVRREMRRQTRGSLEVKTTPSGCMVFVNERYVGLSPIKVDRLYPGRYRVYAQQGQARGRVHTQNVTGDGQQLQIDFDLDQALTTEPFIGFRYADAATMTKKEVEHAAAVARALEAATVFVVGFRQHEGRRTLMGTVVTAATGRVVRSGMIALEPAAPSLSTLGALGSFLLAGKGGSGVIVRSDGGIMTHGAGPGDPGTSSDEGPGFFSARVWKWVTLGVGVGALGAGITLLALDGKGTCETDRCPDAYNTMTPGIIVTAVGGAAAVTSVVLFILDARNPDAGNNEKKTSAFLAPQILPGGAGVSALLRF
jgi:hypothetical protein